MLLKIEINNYLKIKGLNNYDFIFTIILELYKES
jgi:hypothetical protein